MKLQWTESQIVEIAALVAYFGFMNRWNDTMATPLEEEPIEVAEKHIAKHGWRLGKHGHWRYPRQYERAHPSQRGGAGINAPGNMTPPPGMTMPPPRAALPIKEK